MTTRALGAVLLSLGVVGIVVSLAADIFSAGPRGLQAAQLMGIAAGIVVSFSGYWLRQMVPETALQALPLLRASGRRALDLPNLIWILLGFAAVYLTMFIAPMFLSSMVRMKYLVWYLPDLSPIGADLRYELDAVQAWLTSGATPYPLHFFPPFAHIAFAPLLLLNYAAAFRFMTFLTLAAYAFSFGLVMWLGRGRNASAIILLLVTGVFSYGMQFELERGQWNVIVMALCVAAVALGNAGKQARFAACVLLTIAINLKIYPAIFALMLVRDWRDVRGILSLLGTLAVLNAAFLLIAGPRMLMEFISAAWAQFATTENYWVGDHSIRVFVYLLTHNELQVLPAGHLDAWLRAAPAIEWSLRIILGACLALVIARLRTDRATAPDGTLMLVCTLGAMMIPLSNDYKLSILPVAMALAIAGLPAVRHSQSRALRAALLVAAAAAHASVLIPFRYRPSLLVNAFPALLVILLCVTALRILPNARPDREPALHPVGVGE